MPEAAKSPPGLLARKSAVQLLAMILDQHRPLSAAFEDAATQGALKDLPVRDRAFVRAIVATALRRKGQIDDIIRRFLDRPLAAKSGSAYAILLSGFAQILFLDTPPHAAIDLSVSLAEFDRKARALKGLVNAVLRRCADQGKALIKTQDAARLNTPDWLWQRWRAVYGEDETRAIAQAHLITPPLDITVKSDPQGWADRFGGVVLETGTVRIENAGLIAQLPGFGDGAWWVQDTAAALCGRLLGDVAGKRVLDLCAAPGGKTAQLAHAGADVVAVEKSRQRLARLADNLSRLGLSATLECADVLDFDPGFKADAIVLDAPCSATGTIRRNPDVPYLKQPADIRSLVDLQSKLLRHATTLLKPGGVLIYCTCSLEPEEGETQAASALNRGRVERLPITPAEIGGLEHLITQSGDLRTLPHHRAGAEPHLAGMDGFFATRLVLTG